MIKNLEETNDNQLTCFVPLQAKNPKTNINPPKADRGTECPGMDTGCPFLSKRPILGPIRTHPTSAQTAIIKQTIAKNAKYSAT